MEETLKLYRLINGIGTYFVIATDPTTAQTRLHQRLDKDSYGFSKDRQVKEIQLIADQITDDSLGLSGELKKLLI
jgi:hypothetical protein